MMQASQHGAGNKGCEEEAGPSTWPTISGGTQSREDTRMISFVHRGVVDMLHNGKQFANWKVNQFHLALPRGKVDNTFERAHTNRGISSSGFDPSKPLSKSILTELLRQHRLENA